MNEMLTAKELQELLQVDRSTIYRMADAGKLPAIKIGRQWRFPAAQVQAWLEDETSASEQSVSPTVSRTKPPDAIPVSCVQPLTDLVSEILGVMVVVTDMGGYPLTKVSNPCGLFESVIDSPEAIQRCIESWHDLATVIDLEPRLQRSQLGLLCARGLIRAGTSLTGMVFVGGIAPETWPPDPDEIAQLAADFGVSPATVADHIDEVYTLDAKERSELLAYVQRVANIISHMADERFRLGSQLTVPHVPSQAR